VRRPTNVGPNDFSGIPPASPTKKNTPEKKDENKKDDKRD